MKVRILGSAAGGGIPQWNCACTGCTAARVGGLSRTQDTVAVSGDGTAWYLLNASPDIRTQFLAADELAPGPGRRDTPVRGVLLSTAELDHTVGLLSLREAGELTVYASPTVIGALHCGPALLPTLRCYADVRVRVLVPAEHLELEGGLSIQVATVGTKAPRYVTGLDIGSAWVSAFRITDARTGGVFVYATCLPAWTSVFDTVLAGADLALLDGTFLTDGELTSHTGVPRTATSMGHLPIVEAVPAARRHPRVRFVFSHLNNTNPLAYDGPTYDGPAYDGPAYQERATVRIPDVVRVAVDGQLLEC